MTPTTNATPAVAGWRKSSHSGDEGACVEVAVVPGTVAVRDSKDPDGPLLFFAPSAWTAFAETPPQR
ncbi:MULTISPECIES: DUF397 domain-containing protein [Micromonospora]|uniref:DUF397 domain-containing protein n=1 Tax=Micromonospora TaxID=1873 RepID=UPI000F888FE9|nr:DUF397 domain-containing protein [Verrucosispora sp. FIM060022]RUL92981.1 DUF397 domain-containing protein [Verrucosispora sp. FIM060022]